LTTRSTSKAAPAKSTANIVVAGAATIKAATRSTSAKSTTVARVGKAVIPSGAPAAKAATRSAAAKSAAAPTSTKSSAGAAPPAIHASKVRVALPSCQSGSGRLARDYDRLKNRRDDLPFFVRCVDLAFDAFQPGASRQVTGSRASTPAWFCAPPASPRC
jgi:hypothetical protein